MSIVASNRFVEMLTDKMRDKLTYAEMEDMVSGVKDILANFEIEQINIEDAGNDCFIDAYINAMRVEGKSEKTLDRYRYEIERFLKGAGATTMHITQYHIRDYLAKKKEEGNSDMTIKSLCWVLSAYFGWLYRDGCIKRNPMGNIGRIKVQKKVKEVFSEVDIEKLKQNCKRVRDKAIIMFLKSTGCRISEMVGLDIDDIDFTNLECVVLGKGNKQRTVYIDAVTGMVLKEYLDTRDDDNPALFIGIRNERLLPDGVRTMLKNVGKRAGVTHVHPHKFRRTEITELANRGMPIEQIKTLAGHEKIDTTLGYVKIDQLNVKNSYRKYA